MCVGLKFIPKPKPKPKWSNLIDSSSVNPKTIRFKSDWRTRLYRHKPSYLTFLTSKVSQEPPRSTMILYRLQ